MKKLITYVLTIALVLSMFTGCGSNQTAANEESKMKICMILTSGSLGDQANNDAQYNGIKTFADEYGVQFDAVELAEVSDIDMTVRTMVADGYNVFTFNGADGSDQMDILCPEFPDVVFVMNNGTNANGYENLINISNDVAGAAFLCGIFATLMNEHLTGELKCGYIGGVRNPNLERARYAMQAAAELLGGELNSAYVGSFTDAAVAKEIAQQMQVEGVHIIQAWAGGANKGVFEAAETAGEGYYSMGAATGQYHMSDTIVASLKNDLEGVIYDILQKIYNGELRGGEYVASVANGMMSCAYAPDERADIIPESISATLDEYRQMLIKGEIFAPSTEEEYNQFVEEFIAN